MFFTAAGEFRLGPIALARKAKRAEHGGRFDARSSFRMDVTVGLNFALP
jgi:hypothetical protein